MKRREGDIVLGSMDMTEDMDTGMTLTWGHEKLHGSVMVQYIQLVLVKNPKLKSKENQYLKFSRVNKILSFI